MHWQKAIASLLSFWLLETSWATGQPFDIHLPSSVSALVSLSNDKQRSIEFSADINTFGFRVMPLFAVNKVHLDEDTYTVQTAGFGLGSDPLSFLSGQVHYHFTRSAEDLVSDSYHLNGQLSAPKWLMSLSGTYRRVLFAGIQKQSEFNFDSWGSRIEVQYFPTENLSLLIGFNFTEYSEDLTRLSNDLVGLFLSESVLLYAYSLPSQILTVEVGYFLSPVNLGLRTTWFRSAVDNSQQITPELLFSWSITPDWLGMISAGVTGPPSNEGPDAKALSFISSGVTFSW